MNDYEKSRLILIAGETARGKDTLSHILQDNGMKAVCSYTTRPIRERETEGVEHYFIDSKKAAELLEDKDNIVAYTKIGEFEYFATTKELEDANIYVIDPKGIEYLKEKHPEFNYYTIYVTTSDEVAKERAMGRGDDIEVFEKRTIAEKEQFESFTDYDFKYDNSGSYENLKSFAKVIVDRERAKEQVAHYENVLKERGINATVKNFDDITEEDVLSYDETNGDYIQPDLEEDVLLE